MTGPPDPGTFAMSSTLIDSPPPGAVDDPSPEELKLSRRATRRYGLFAPHLMRAALKQSFVMLRPDIQWKNPVMFVVEGGTVLSVIFTVARLVGYSSPVRVTYLLALDVWLLLTVLFANFATALAEARGKAQADALRKTRRETPAFRQLPDGTLEETNSTLLKAGDLVAVTAGTDHPRRRRDHRRCRLGRRVGHHGRIGPRDSRSRWRSLRRHWRYASAVGSDRGADHRGRRQIVPRPDDRPRRRGHPPADAQRDRPLARALCVHSDLFNRHGRALADGPQRGTLHAGLPRRAAADSEPGDRHTDARGSVGLPDSDDDRGPAGGNRHRGYGPGPASQRARQERQGGRSGRRYRHATLG